MNAIFSDQLILVPFSPAWRTWKTFNYHWVDIDDFRIAIPIHKSSAETTDTKSKA